MLTIKLQYWCTTFFWSFLAVTTLGCSATADEEQSSQETTLLETVNSGRSADYMLRPSEYDEFQSGRQMKEIFSDLAWHGEFIEAADHRGKQVYVILFGLFDRPYSTDGEVVLAVFVDEKFEKFVRYPTAKFEKRKVGESLVLSLAVESESVSIAELKQELVDNPVPSQIDPGLTIAWKLLHDRVTASEAARNEDVRDDLRKNIELRDQFNAMRLRLGMSEQKVEAILKSKPIEQGRMKAGDYKIYGSTESFAHDTLVVDGYLHYPNILILFRKGKVAHLYSIPGGQQSLKLSREMFSDLPPISDQKQKQRE